MNGTADGSNGRRERTLPPITPEALHETLAPGARIVRAVTGSIEVYHPSGVDERALFHDIALTAAQKHEAARTLHDRYDFAGHMELETAQLRARMLLTAVAASAILATESEAGARYGIPEDEFKNAAIWFASELESAFGDPPAVGCSQEEGGQDEDAGGDDEGPDCEAKAGVYVLPFRGPNGERVLVAVNAQGRLVADPAYVGFSDSEQVVAAELRLRLEEYQRQEDDPGDRRGDEVQDPEMT